MENRNNIKFNENAQRFFQPVNWYKRPICICMYRNTYECFSRLHIPISELEKNIIFHLKCITIETGSWMNETTSEW